LDISLRGYSLCSCPQHSLKALLLQSLLLLNPMYLLKYCDILARSKNCGAREKAVANERLLNHIRL
jgi:hypothetical protein